MLSSLLQMRKLRLREVSKLLKVAQSVPEQELKSCPQEVINKRVVRGASPSTPFAVLQKLKSVP